jgi:adenylate cyclase
MSRSAEGAFVMREFFEELKQRRVIRTAIVYMVVGFGIAQAADLLVPALLLPEWTYRFIILLLILGLPVTLVLSWQFDLTPEGVKRAPATNRAIPSSRAAGYAGVGILIGLVGFGGYAYQQQVAGPADGAEATRKIAVLPFTTMAGDEENEYFADGLTEDILTNLGQVRDFTVISRTSVMRYKGSDKSVPEIARELGVRYVVEGSMRRAGDRVRVVVQLIEPGTDTRIWGETLDRQVSDIFALQSEIARSVVDALQVRLASGVRERLERVPTEDVAAYERFIRGRDLYHQRTPEKLESAIALFDEAIARDPNFALAHAWRAMSHMIAVLNYGGARSRAEAARSSAERALRLQPDLVDAHRAHAMVLTAAGRMDEAAAAYERALALNPNDFAAMVNIATIVSRRGEVDRAIEWARRSIRHEPARSQVAYGNIASYMLDLGLLDLADSAAARALLLVPGYGPAHVNLAVADLGRGRRAEAVARLRSVATNASNPREASIAASVLLLAGEHEEALAVYETAFAQAFDALALNGYAPDYAWLLQRRGERERAREVLTRAEAVLRSAIADGNADPTARAFLARGAAVLGDHATAVALLEEAERAGYLDRHAVYRNQPVWSSLAGNARFEAAMQRMRARIEPMRHRIEREGL